MPTDPYELPDFSLASRHVDLRLSSKGVVSNTCGGRKATIDFKVPSTGFPFLIGKPFPLYRLATGGARYFCRVRDLDGVSLEDVKFLR
jgi:hypothetical protein